MGDYRLNRLSKHFCHRWRERVGSGTAPTVQTVKQIMDESVIVQSYRELYSPKGHREKILAVFWHPDRKVVISYDKSTGTAVTVLTKKNMPLGKRLPKRANKKVKFNKSKSGVWPGFRHIQRETKHAG